MSDIISTTNTDPSPQLSFDVEEPGKIQDRVPDEEAVKKQSHGRSCFRNVFCICLSLGVICCIIGAIIYFTVSKPPKQPVLHTGSYNKSAIGSDIKEQVSKPDVTTSRPSPQVERGVFCPQNWTFYNGKCYLFSSFPVHISDSKEYCGMEGGVPLMSNIVTEEFREFLTSNMRNIIGCCLYDMSVRHQTLSIVENIDDEIDRSMNIPHGGEKGLIGIVKDQEGVLSQSSTSLPVFTVDTLAFFPPEENRMDYPSAGSIDRTPMSHDTSNDDTLGQQALLPSLEYDSITSPHPEHGFWLGAGHHKSHESHGGADIGALPDDNNKERGAETEDQQVLSTLLDSITSPHPIHGFWLGAGHHKNHGSHGGTVPEVFAHDAEIFQHDSDISTSSGGIDNKNHGSHDDANIEALTEGFGHEEQQTLSSLLEYDSITLPHPIHGFWLGAGCRKNHESHGGALPEGFAHDGDIFEHDSEISTSHGGIDNTADMMKLPGIDSDADITAMHGDIDDNADMMALDGEFDRDTDMPALPEDFDQDPPSNNFHQHPLPNEALLTSDNTQDSTTSRETSNRKSKSNLNFDWETTCREYEDYLPLWQNTDCHGSLVQVCERSAMSGSSFRILGNEKIQTTNGIPLAYSMSADPAFHPTTTVPGGIRTRSNE